MPASRSVVSVAKCTELLTRWYRLGVPSRRRQFGPETHEETEHRSEVKSSDDAGNADGRDSTEAQDGQDQLRRSDRGGV